MGFFAALGRDHDARRSQFGQQRIEIVDPEIDHHLLRARAKIGRILLERHPHRAGLGVRVIAPNEFRETVGIRDPEMTLVPLTERARIACPKENAADPGNSSHARPFAGFLRVLPP